jgi:hypothetical protein
VARQCFVAATAQSLSLALAAQTALIGKLLSMLMRWRVLDLSDAAALLTDTADMIKEPLDRSPSVKLRSVWQVVRDWRQCPSRSPPRGHRLMRMLIVALQRSVGRGMTVHATGMR